jgi:hypothetical protein
MTSRTLNELTIRAEDVDFLEGQKARTENHIALWKARAQYCESILVSTEIKELMDELLARTQAAYRNAFSDDLEYTHTTSVLGAGIDLTALDSREPLYNCFGVHANLMDRLERSINRAIDDIIDLERRISVAESTANTITIRDTRRKLNPLSYIRNGSVKFAQLRNGSPALKFTVINTYISPSEPWEEVHSSFKYVIPFEDKPYILLPPINVTVDFLNKQLHLKAGRSENKIRFRNNRIHPHYSNGACLGNMDASIHEAITSLDVRFIAATVRTWLQTATTNDTWGSSLYHGFTYMADKILANAENPDLRGRTMSRPAIYFDDAGAPSGYAVSIAGQRRKVDLKEVAKGVYELYLDEVLIGQYDPHNL